MSGAAILAGGDGIARDGHAWRERRASLEAYFDRTAAAQWRDLTSDVRLGRIRGSVRTGRTQMRAALLAMLPDDLAGRRVLDAGCGTGAFAIEAAARGAEVVAVDLSPTLLGLASERLPTGLRGSVRFETGDMLGVRGRFDHVVAMDSLIHYPAGVMADAVARLASVAERSVLATYAPRTRVLAVLHATGRLFPRGDRAPSIEPVAPARLVRLLDGDPRLADWRRAREARIERPFYASRAVELVRR